MAKKAKLNTNLDDYIEDDFYKQIKLIKQLLLLNILSFVDLPVAMGVFGPLIVTWDDARTSVFYPGKAADTAAARTAIQTTITTNGTWLNNFCSGDLSLLKKTGYPLAAEGTAQGKLDSTILTFTVLNVLGSIGFLISHIQGQGIKYAIMYTLESNPETDPSKWTFYYAAQRDGVIIGLESGKRYKMVSVALGTSNDITYSNPVSITPQ
jgi:hypothetical protein